MQVQECTEFYVAIPNRPGSFAQLSQQLTERGVRMRAFMLYTSYIMNLSQYPQVVPICKLVASDDERARAALADLGFQFHEMRGLLLRSRKRVDFMPVILKKLADAGLSLIDAYGVLPAAGEELFVVLSVSDEQRGYDIARRLDWSVAGQQSR